MSNVITVDAIRAEVDQQYAPVTIGLSDGSETVLKNILRLSKTTREVVLEEVKAIQDAANTETEVLADHVANIIDLVSDNGQALLNELDGDLALLMKILEVWMDKTQLGEAENSPTS